MADNNNTNTNVESVNCQETIENDGTNSKESKSPSSEDVQLNFNEEINVKNEFELSLNAFVKLPTDTNCLIGEETEIVKTEVSTTTITSCVKSTSSSPPELLVSDKMSTPPQSASTLLPPAPFMAKVSREAATGYNIFECTVCYQRFPNYSSLSKHRLKHTKAFKEFNCWHCKKKFTRVGELRSHMKLWHNEPYLFECPSCLRRFQGKNPLLKHELYCRQTKYECYFCGQMMNSYKELLIHSVGHYSCMFCGSRYDDICSLEKHERTHLPAFEYPDKPTTTPPLISSSGSTPVSSISRNKSSCNNTKNQQVEVQPLVTKTITLPPATDSNSASFLLLTVDPETGALKLQPISQDELPALQNKKLLPTEEHDPEAENKLTDNNQHPEDAQPQSVVTIPSGVVGFNSVSLSLPFNGKPYTPIAPKPTNYSQSHAIIHNVSNSKNKHLSEISLSLTKTHKIKKSLVDADKKMIGTCENCSMSFKTINDFETPCTANEESAPASKSPPLSDSDSDSTEPTLKRCNQCHRTFEGEVETISASAVKKYFCQLCGALFITKTTLNKHLDVAHNVKPYILCNYCTARSNLKRPISANSAAPKLSKSNDANLLLTNDSTKKSRPSSGDGTATHPIDQKASSSSSSSAAATTRISGEVSHSLEEVTVKSEPEETSNDFDILQVSEDCELKPDIKEECYDDDVLR